MRKTKQSNQNQNIPENQYIPINNYKVIKILGKGAYGTVYQAIKKDNQSDTEMALNINENSSQNSQDKYKTKIKTKTTKNYYNNKKYYAIKAFDKDLSKKGIHPSILREIGILKELSNHHYFNQLFIQLEDVILENDRIFAIYEYGGISLLTFIEEKCSHYNYKNNQTHPHPHPILNLQFGINIFFQIINSIQFLHNLGIVHRDLKPENILINEDNLQIKIADFGLARSIRNHSYTNFTNDVVTIYYKSPELIIYSNMDNFNNKNHFIPEISLPFSIDSWSIGVIALELFIIICNQYNNSQNQNYSIYNTRNHLKNQKNDSIIWSPFFFEGNELSVLDSIQKILHPSQKINNLKNLLLPLFQSYPQIFYLISELLELDPNKRCSCIQAFQILENFKSNN
ncbi:Ser/Thr protein kinase [Cryptosporidium parvum]|uniref:Protein kinase domain-containing protein n=2 Tax=Cryptosporidium parvum TaxID=5807 RepID=A0A7S7LI82_CRYPV|nr:Serine/threonine-protein kinase [Cryptosporidium parvum]WKS76688.1 Ser/Thr protein kinase [Cryptosporidium sp. 43IA8]WRK31181.1 Serine/threonine-protein kinase [Cryptosporidium parvum]|eukprot:QOY42840.1 hypothetical protein CPATCC_000521 [Cryptosporidium parvum]